MAVPMRLANSTCLGLFTILSTPEASCSVIASGSGHQAVAAAPGILTAVSLYHRSRQPAAAIVVGGADP